MLDFITINEHSSIRIDEGKIIYSDPFNINGEPHDADIILITHSHFDHYSPDDIRKVMKSDTVIVCPQTMTEADELGLAVRHITPWERAEVSGIRIQAVPAYNTGKPFHPESNGWVGYIINSPTHGEIYIAGDTDATPDAGKVTCDIALVPVGGTYTTDASQAAQLVNDIHPRYAVPIHYGTVAGTPADGEKFREYVNNDIEVIIKL